MVDDPFNPFSVPLFLQTLQAHIANDFLVFLGLQDVTSIVAISWCYSVCECNRADTACLGTKTH